MTPLTREFVDQCPVEGDFRMRGKEMTRIEVFIDAAFAFAVTMLVISFDHIPQNWDEIIVAIKSIPAFAIAVAQLVWIWHEHSVWSRRYGLEDAMTVLLSAILLIVVLVYIYPLRIMAGGMFSWMTGGYLPSSFDLQSYEQLSGMFVFMGCGFASMCTVFWLFYRYSARRNAELLLSQFELYSTHTLAGMWFGFMGIGLLAIVAAILIPEPWTPFAGFTYMLMAVWGPLYPRYRDKHQPEDHSSRGDSVSQTLSSNTG